MMTSQYTQSLLPPRKASSLPSTGLVSGSIESSHSSAMLQKEPQKPVKSHTTSKALPEPRMDRRPPACVKQSLPASYLRHSMALKHGMQAVPNHHAYTTKTANKLSATEMAGMSTYLTKPSPLLAKESSQSGELPPQSHCFGTPASPLRWQPSKSRNCVLQCTYKQ